MMQPSATNPAAHPIRARALALMLEGRSDREIAEELGCERSTVWRWRVDPRFARELQAAYRERLAVLNDRMMALVPCAIDTIAEIMNDAAQPAMLRMRAAESLLERAAWSTGATERRFQEHLTEECDSLLATLAGRVSVEVLDAVVKALTEPWEETKDPPKRRPRVVVLYPGANGDDEEEIHGTANEAR